MAGAFGAWAASNGASVIGGEGTLDGTKHILTVSAPTYVNPSGNDSANRNERGWYAGISITWNSKTQKATGTTAAVTDNINAHNVGSFNVYNIPNWNNSVTGSGISGLGGSISGITRYITSATWWAHITPEDALKLNGADYTATLTIAGETFQIVIPAAVYNAGLYDSDGIRWLPAVATVNGKVYGDLNMAIKTLGTVECAADAAVTEAIAIAENSTLVLKANGYTISGLNNLTLKGGTFDFDPSAAGCTIATGYEAQDNGDNTWTVVRGHEHQWSFTLNGATLTANCTNMAKPCDVPDRTTAIELTVTGGGDGVAPTFAIANRDTFLGYVNKDGEIVTIADTYTVTRTTEDGAAYDKWYVGNYKVTCVATVNGEAQTLEKAFTIAKGAEYTSGYAVASRDIRYGSFAEAVAAAQDGDTIYYRDGNISVTSLAYNADKNVTLNFGAATITYQLGKNDGKGSDVTIGNGGNGKLTLDNVVLKQPYGYEYDWGWKKVSHNFLITGKIGFGASVQAVVDGDDYMIYSTGGLLEVAGGIYQCKFAENGGKVSISGGDYLYTDHCKPTLIADGHVVVTRTLEGYGNYYAVLPHAHDFYYETSGNVVYIKCKGANYDGCDWTLNENTLTLTASDKNDDGQPYALTQVVCTDDFLYETMATNYYRVGDTEELLPGPPSTFGDYKVKVTVTEQGAAGEVTATVEASFKVIHVHNFVYDADEAAGTLTARCTTTEGCDFNLNQRVATLTVENGTYNGSAQELAAVTKNTEDFPDEVSLTYSSGGAPTEAGNYTAMMTVGGTSVTKTFTIAPAELSSLELSATTLYYTAAEQYVSIASVLAGGTEVKDQVAVTGVTNATAIGSYSVTVTANSSNVTGSKTVSWEIRNTSGAVKGSEVVGDCGIAKSSDTFFTLENSRKLEYADTDTWWATIRVSFSHSDKDYTLSDYGYATYTSPYAAKITVDGVTVSAHDIAEAGSVNFLHSTATAGVGTGSYKYSLAGGSRDYYYTDYIQFHVGFSLGEVKAAAAGSGYLTWTMNLGAVNYEDSQSVEFKDYTVQIPVTSEDFVLFNDNAEQRYPEHTHAWTPLAVEGCAVTSVCQNAGCAIGSVWVRLDIANKVYDGAAISASYAKSADFDTYFPGTEIGTVRYYDAAENEIAAPKYTGSYTAKLDVGGLTIAVPFQIRKPEAGYTDGWEVNNTPTSVRYDTWEEALAAAQDGDTVYYHEDDRDFAEHEFSIGEKNLTLDFGGKTLTRTDSALSGMTIKNTGAGTLILQNVVLKQPRGTFSGHISTSGNIVFGEGVKVVNTATDSGNYCKITATGSLIVSNGLYQCSFATLSGTVLIAGGKFWENYYPTEFVNAITHVIRTIEGDYKYEVVAHTHVFAYTGESNVITCACEGEDAAFCAFNQAANVQTVTLTATNIVQTGMPYDGATITYSDRFPMRDLVITYFIDGGAQLPGAPTEPGNYTASITVGNATAYVQFAIVKDKAGTKIFIF